EAARARAASAAPDVDDAAHGLQRLLRLGPARTQAQRLLQLTLCLAEIAGADEELSQAVVGGLVVRMVPDRAPETQLVAGPVLYGADEGRPEAHLVGAPELASDGHQIAVDGRIVRIQIQAAQELLPRALEVALLAERQPELCAVAGDARRLLDRRL